MRSSVVALVAIIGSMTAAAAQQLPSSDVAPGHTDPRARDPYVTSTGATVPNPGKPQGGPTTPQERAIQRQDNRIDSSICKGC